VVVEAPASDGPDPSALPASVTVIPVDDRLPPSADVASVLDAATGTAVQHLGGLGDWSAVSIRGSSLRQVTVCLDGIPLNPDGSAVVNLSELPLHAFSRVELWRGNAPPELGAAPIGGIVNLVTGDERATSVSAAYGSLHTARMDAVASLPNLLLFADVFSTNGDFRWFDDNGTIYNDRDDAIRVRDNNDKSQISAHARWRSDGPVRVSVLDSFLAREEGLPGHANQPTPDARLETLRNIAAVQVEGGSADWRGKARVWGHLRDETIDDRLGNGGNRVPFALYRSLSGGILTDARWSPSAAFVPNVTLDLRRDTIHREDLDGSLEDLDRSRNAATLSAAATLRGWGDRIVATPIVQAQYLDGSKLVDPDLTGTPSGLPVDDTLWTVNPRLGVLVRPIRSLSLKANGGRYVRPPDLVELYGDQGAFRGNAALVPEQGLQWDVGARFVAPENRVVDATIEASYFWNSATNLIVYVQNSQRALYPLNLGRAWVQGAEASAQVDLFDVIESQSAVTQTITVNLDRDPVYSNNQLPRHPALEIEQRTALHWRDGVRLGHTFSYAAGNYWDATNWYLSPPRPLHGLYARVRAGKDGPEIGLDVLNVGDRIAEVVDRNPLDPEDDARIVQAITDYVGYPLPGRTVLVSVRWNP
jgi:vitamin B12 transporter